MPVWQMAWLGHSHTAVTRDSQEVEVSKTRLVGGAPACGRGVGLQWGLGGVWGNLGRIRR